MLETSVEDSPDSLDSGVLSGAADGQAQPQPSIDYNISRVKIGKPCKTSRICNQEKGERCYKQEGDPPRFTEITEMRRNSAGKIVPTGEEGNCVNPLKAYSETSLGDKLKIGDRVVAINPESVEGCLGKEGRVAVIDRISEPSRRESEPGSGELIYDVTCLNRSVFHENRGWRGYWWNEIRAATDKEISGLEAETGEFNLSRGNAVRAVNPGSVEGCLGIEGRVGRIQYAFGWRGEKGELYYNVRCLNMWCFQNQYWNYRYDEIQRITEDEVDEAIEASKLTSPFRCLYGGGSIKIHKRKRNKKTKRKRKKTKRRKRTVKRSKRRNR